MTRTPRHFPLVLFLIASLCPAAPFAAGAQKISARKPPAEKPAGLSSSGAEARTAKAFDDARRQGPLALRAFLFRMPKGADLHSHLSGAIYAESWIRAAGEDHLCVDTKTLAFVKPVGVNNDLAVCKPGEVPASTVPQNQHLYDDLIDAFSMRTFVPVAADSGHDHFFATFDKFGGTDKRHMGEWLDEVATRAAAQNEQYLELMDTPDFKSAAALAASIGYNPNFVEYRQKLLSSGLKESIPAISAALDRAEEDRKQREHCGQPDAQPACDVKIRYIYQILRGLPPETVFAQVVLGSEAATADPRFVGMNFVQPEDGYISMRDYRLQMQMLDAVH